MKQFLKNILYLISSSRTTPSVEIQEGKSKDPGTVSDEQNVQHLTMISRLNGQTTAETQGSKKAKKQKTWQTNLNNESSLPFLCRSACFSPTSCSPPLDPAASVFACAAGSSPSAAHPAAVRSLAAAEWPGERVDAESYWPDVEQVADKHCLTVTLRLILTVWLQLVRSMTKTTQTRVWRLSVIKSNLQKLHIY